MIMYEMQWQLFIRWNGIVIEKNETTKKLIITLIIILIYSINRSAWEIIQLNQCKESIIEESELSSVFIDISSIELIKW